jgi:predicted RNase H-like HicB family nuclease
MAQDAIKGWREIAIEDGEEIPVEHHRHIRQVAIS